VSHLRLVLATVLLGAAASASHPPTLSACSCRPTDLLSGLVNSDVIFTGTPVWSADPHAGQPNLSSADPLHYHFAVDRVYKGEPAESLLVLSARMSMSCGYMFKTGRRYLVYAWTRNDTLVTGLCTRNAPIDRAGDDLAFLETVPNGTTAEVNAALAASARDSLDDPRPDVRKRALIIYEATADSAEVRHVLLKALGDPAPEVRGTALISWRTRIRRDGASLAPILPLLHDPERYLRLAAIGTMAGAEDNADSAVAILAPLTRDPDPELRRTVANTLRLLEDDAASAREHLLTIWNTDSSSRVRVEALWGLSPEKPPSDETIARFRAAARDTAPAVRAATAAILGVTSVSDETWSAVLRIDLLADPDPRVRDSAAISVRAHGTDVWHRVPPRTVLPILAEAVKDTSYSVYTGAIGILGMTGRREAVPILVRVLADPRERKQAEALRALGELGPLAVTAVPRLRQLEAGAPGPTRRIVAETLRKIEGEDR
jgi:HEAT repeat protein